MTRWNILRDRIRGLLRREAVLQDIDEELRSHIDMETEANIRRGMAPEEARRAARRAFGNLGGVQDAAHAIRGGGSLETWWQDLRFAARMLRRNPVVTLSAVLTWALGIGAVVAVFSVVHPVLIRALPFRDPERLVSIKETCLPKFSSFAVSPGNFLAWRDGSRAFEDILSQQQTALTLTGVGEPARVRGLRVNAGFFELFGVPPIIGRGFLAEEDAPQHDAVVILSHGFWRSRFGGDPSVLHRGVTLDDRSYTVVGIMPPDLHPVMGDVDLWVPAAFTPEQRQRHGSHYLGAVARLKPGVTLEAARASLNEIAEQLAAQHPVTNQGWRVKIDPLGETLVGNVRPTLLVLSAAVAFVLLIACANVASLLLGRASSREREIALRVALGAGRGRILRQLATESILLSSIGGAFGLVLAVVGVDLLLALAPQGLGSLTDIRVDVPLLAFTFGASVVTGLVVALAPARQASRADLNAVLKEGHRGVVGGGHARVRRTLVVVQVASCVLLLVGAGLLLQSLGRLLAVDPGFDADNVVTMEINLPDRKYPDAPSRAAFFTRALAETRSLPGVRAAAVAQTIPFEIDWLFSFWIDGRPEEEAGKEPSANYYGVTPDYFRVMGIRLLRGRTFTDADIDGAPRVVVVNDKLAQQFFPDGDAVGKRIRFRPEQTHEIVGVVADVKQYGLAGPVTYQMYEPFLQSPFGSMTLTVRSEGDPTALTAAIRSRLATIDRNQPVAAVKTMAQIVSESVARRRFLVALLGVFAAVALALAVVGIYGVISDATTQRTHEIGVRMALGARSRDVVRLMMGQGLLPALAGTLLGLLGCLGAMRLLSGLLYGVQATDPLTLALASAGIAAVAAVASYVPARRAMRVDPMVAIRLE